MWLVPLPVILQFTERDQIMYKFFKSSDIWKKSKLEAKKTETKLYPSLLLMNVHKFSSYKRELKEQTIQGTESDEVETAKMPKLKNHSCFQYSFLKHVFRYFSCILNWIIIIIIQNLLY